MSTLGQTYPGLEPGISRSLLRRNSGSRVKRIAPQQKGLFSSTVAGFEPTRQTPYVFETYPLTTRAHSPAQWLPTAGPSQRMRRLSTPARDGRLPTPPQRSVLGIEPRTSSTLRKNHATRPNGREGPASHLPLGSTRTSSVDCSEGASHGPYLAQLENRRCHTSYNARLWQDSNLRGKRHTFSRRTP